MPDQTATPERNRLDPPASDAGPVGPAGPAPDAEARMAATAKPKPAKTKKPGKGKGGGKDKAKGKGKGKQPAGASVASHPRAHSQIRRAKGWGGLGGFALAAYFSYRAGVPPDQIGMRAIAAGIAGYMLAWACTVTVWRYLLLAELKALAESHHRPGAVPTAESADLGAPAAAAVPSPAD